MNITEVAKRVGQQAEDEHGEQAQEALAAVNEWKDRVGGFVRANPAVCLVGAFFVGFTLAKVARYA